MSHVLAFLLFVCLIVCAGAGSLQAASKTQDDRAWPRQYSVNGTQFSVYRPELDSWSNNQLQCRAVMAVRTAAVTDDSGKPQEQYRYGVVWLKARTETDTQGRVVTLNEVAVTKINFPTARDQEAQYQSMLQSVTVGKSLTMSLDQLEAALAIANNRKAQPLQVGNAPPDIIFSFSPAVLVRVDGDPVWRASGVAGVDKAINTRALLARYQGRFYLGYADHWAVSSVLNTGWAPAPGVPPPLLQLMRAAEATNQAPSQGDIPPDLAEEFSNGKFPAVYVRTRPAELISINGDPQFTTIAGTSLSYVSNTAADVFVNGGAGHIWYVLISGRWFSAPASKGPWHYIAANTLPPDFAHIPEDSPKGAVLASVSGTPQAREAVIANAVPQTAKVDRSTLNFQARYDGKAQFRPLPGSKNLTYAINSAVPILEVPGHGYYALSDGVWFVSEASPDGPWVVATSVQPDIYAIPPSSPLHYITYVRIYGSSGRYVYVGYTPGYYGTVVTNDTVVYGTGYPCSGWVGTDWYGCAETYGYGAALAYGSAVGWGMAFGWGWDYPWYNPWWGPWSGYYPDYYPWAYGGAAAWNVYGRWGNSVVVGTRAAWANPWTGNAGRAGAGGFYNPYTGTRGHGYAARNINAYTGRTTAVAGGIARGPGGATAAGAFNTTGPGGDAQGAGYARTSDRTGEVHRGGALDINGNIYAGRDGNVYRNTGSGWEKMGGDNRFASSQPAAGLDGERLARERGTEREAAVNNFQRQGGFGPGGGDFGSLTRFGSMGARPSGGFRGGLGGGMRGGGRRR